MHFRLRSNVCLGLLVAVFFVAPVLKGAVVRAFLPLESSDFAQGDAFRVPILIANHGAKAERVDVPRHLRVQWPGRPLENLVLDEAILSSSTSVVLEPGRFVLAAYWGRVPMNAETGANAIAFPDLPPFQAVLTVRRAAASSVAQGTAFSTLPPHFSISAKHDPTVSDADGRFSAYEPMYFIVGSKDGGATSRFQFSLKYRLGDHTFQNFFLTHTSLSVWDHYRPSGPFRDTSHMPGVTLLRPQVWGGPDKRLQLDLWFGYEHESNGRGAPDDFAILSVEDLRKVSSSRSTNKWFVRPVLTMGHPDKFRLLLSAKIHTDKPRGRENLDITRYRGHVDWSATSMYRRDLALTAAVRKGDGWRGSVQLDLAVRAKRVSAFMAPGWKMPGWLLVQWFNGHGETLLDYDTKRPSQWRFGYELIPWFNAKGDDVH